MQLQLQSLNAEINAVKAELQKEPVHVRASTAASLDTTDTGSEIEQYRILLVKFRKHLEDIKIESDQVTQRCDELWDNITKSDSTLLTSEVVKSLLELHSTMESHKDAIQKLHRSQIDKSIFASTILPPIAIYRINDYFKQNNIIPLRISLLFRASENAFSANAFHHHCDSKGPTLVVAKSEPDALNPTGRIFGGFTLANWSRIVEAREGSHQDFLFSLQWEEMLPKLSSKNSRQSNSIFTAGFQGPQFGQSPELKLSDQCDKILNSFSTLGKGPRTFEEPEGSTSFVNGNEGFFFCEDYEVYSVSIYSS